MRVFSHQVSVEESLMSAAFRDMERPTSRLPSRFCETENEKRVRAGFETSRGIDEVAGAFGQDTLKWPRRWHRLLESARQNSSCRSLSSTLRVQVASPRTASVPFLAFSVCREKRRRLRQIALNLASTSVSVSIETDVHNGKRERKMQKGILHSVVPEKRIIPLNRSLTVTGKNSLYGRRIEEYCIIS